MESSPEIARAVAERAQIILACATGAPNLTYRVVYIRFVGTHKQYDQIDAQNI